MPPKTSWKERHKKKIKLSYNEKTILKNIDKNYKKVGRYDNILMFFDNEENHEEMYVFRKDLFQFIKEGKEYKISDLLGDE